jgi:hypothetical protein
MIERNNQAFVAAQIESRRNGRYGSKATHSILSDHVRFTPDCVAKPGCFLQLVQI